MLIVFIKDFLEKSIRIRLRLILFIFSMFFIHLQYLYGQEKVIPPAQLIMKDTIDLGDSVKKGLINKLIQPFRFRDNQQKRERERVVQLIRRLTVKGDIAIDSSTVEMIADDLLSLTSSLSTLQDTTGFLQEEIQQILMNLNSKASKQLVDSVQIQLGNVLQGILDQSNAASAAFKKDGAGKLADIRLIQLSCGAEGLPVLQETLGDTLLVNYQKCLRAKTRIFAWYTRKQNSSFPNFNLNYLTDLIWDGYVLQPNGLEANSRELALLLDSAYLAKSQSFQKGNLLVVKTNSGTVSSAFINQLDAQEQFIERIKSLIADKKLSGVVLSLEGLVQRDQENLAAFVGRLKSELVNLNQDLVLALALPPLSNSATYELASSFDFASLNPWVDFYLVRTDKLNHPETRIPFAYSPLYADPNNSRGSIEQTIGFYLNGKISPKKLVISLGYEGMYWTMPDFFPGSRALSFGTPVSYGEIQSEILSKVKQQKSSSGGFDAIQAASYFNYESETGLKQLWYEDSQSLGTKYQWVLANNLGGISIYGIGTDDGYTELWDILGSTLIEVDSVVLNSQLLNKEPDSNSLGIWDYVSVYWNDLQWAGINDIYIGNPNRKPEARYCAFEPYPKADTLKLMANANGIGSFWEFTSKFEKYPKTENYSILDDKACICLLGRWEKYARINVFASLLLFILLGIAAGITFFGIRDFGEEWSLKNLFIGICIGLGLLAFITLFFYFFFNTQVGFIGAGSNEVTVWVLILFFGVGILAGLIINRLLMARGFTQRDLP